MVLSGVDKAVRDAGEVPAPWFLRRQIDKERRNSAYNGVSFCD